MTLLRKKPALLSALMFSVQTVFGLVVAPNALAQVPSPVPLPGRWSVPVPIFVDPNNPPDLSNPDLHQPPFFTENGAQWALAPAGGFAGHLPQNVFALRLETPGNLVDLGVVSVPISYFYAAVEMPAGTKISDLSQLSFDSFYESGVSCGGGSFRYQLAISKNGDGNFDGNVFVYAGSYPSFSGCPSGVWSHNDLLAGTLNFDSTQLGGPFYGTQSDADNVAGSSHEVLSVGLVWDSWWLAPGKSVVWGDNLRVNNFLLDEPGIGHVCSLLTGLGGATDPCP